MSSKTEAADEPTEATPEEGVGPDVEPDRVRQYLEIRAKYFDTLAERGLGVTVPNDSPFYEHCRKYPNDELCRQAATGGPADVAKQAHETYLDVRTDYIEELKDHELMDLETMYGGTQTDSGMGYGADYGYGLETGQSSGLGNEYGLGFWDNLVQVFRPEPREIKSLACQLTGNLALPPFLRRIHQMQCQRNQQQRNALEAGFGTAEPASSAAIDAGLQDLVNFAVAVETTMPSSGFDVDDDPDLNDPIMQAIDSALTSAAGAGMNFDFGLWSKIKNVAKKIGRGLKKAGRAVKNAVGRSPVLREILKYGARVGCKFAGRIPVPAIAGIASGACRIAGFSVGMEPSDPDVNPERMDELHVGALYYLATLDVATLQDESDQEQQGIQGPAGSQGQVRPQGQTGDQQTGGTGGMQTIDIMS